VVEALPERRGRGPSGTLSSAPSPSGPDWLGGNAESLGGTRALSGLGCGRKIYHYLRQRAFSPLPAPSTITAILRRHGRLNPQHPSAQGPWQRFEHPAANDLWQMDFKGPLQTLRAGRCHPLGLLDDYSRFALALEACPNQSTPTVQARLQSIFSLYGLPRCILCDKQRPLGMRRQLFALYRAGSLVVTSGSRCPPWPAFPPPNPR
jgi:transposase InsO family protein